jgi:cytochrome bd-type quinol oxidase subunit 1
MYACRELNSLSAMLIKTANGETCHPEDHEFSTKKKHHKTLTDFIEK